MQKLASRRSEMREIEFQKMSGGAFKGSGWSMPQADDTTAPIDAKKQACSCEVDTTLVNLS